MSPGQAHYIILAGLKSEIGKGWAISVVFIQQIFLLNVESKGF